KPGVPSGPREEGAMGIVARMLTQEQDGIPGYAAHPDGPGSRPGILMVHHAHGVTADHKIDAYRLATLGYNDLAPSLSNMFGIAPTLTCGSLVFGGGKDSIATPASQGPLWQSFIASGPPVEWHFFSDANHGFRHPDNEGFQPHYADLAWPLVTDFLQRRVSP